MGLSVASSTAGDDDTLIDFEPCNENIPGASLENAMKLAWANRANNDLRAIVKELKTRIRILEMENEFLSLQHQDKQVEIRKFPAPCHSSRNDDLEYEHMERQNRKLQNTVKTLQSELQAARDERDDCFSRLSKLRKNGEPEYEHLGRKIRNLEETVKTLQSAAQAAESEVQASRDERDWHMAQHTRILKEKNATKELMNGYSKATSHVEEEVKGLRLQNGALKTENADLVKKMETLQADNETMKSETAELRQKGEDLSSENEKMEGKMARLKNKANSIIVEKSTIIAEKENIIAEQVKTIESLTKGKSTVEDLQDNIEKLKEQKSHVAHLLASVVVDLDIVHSGYRIWTCEHPKGLLSIDYNGHFRAGPFRTSYMVKKLFKQAKDDSDFMEAYFIKQAYHENHAFYHEKAGHSCPSFNTGVLQADYSEMLELFSKVNVDRDVSIDSHDG